MEWSSKNGVDSGWTSREGSWVEVEKRRKKKGEKREERGEREKGKKKFSKCFLDYIVCWNFVKFFFEIQSRVV